jgi:uncharacterized protein YdaU (DUF1376 family)
LRLNLFKGYRRKKKKNYDVKFQKVAGDNMPPLQYFPFEPVAWLSSSKVLAMSDAQRGVYIHLLAIAWQGDGCHIPKDKATIQRLCPRSKWSNIEYILKECFEDHGPGLANMRLLSDYTKAISKSEKSRESVNYREELRNHLTDDNRTMIERLAKKKFVRPSISQIKEYCELRKNGVDPEVFFRSSQYT